MIIFNVRIHRMPLIDFSFALYPGKLGYQNRNWISSKCPQYSSFHLKKILSIIINSSISFLTLTNYRGISLTSDLCKTMERIISLHIRVHLSNFDIISKNIIGFHQTFQLWRICWNIWILLLMHLIRVLLWMSYI